MEKISGIYKITCLTNGKCYIGQSVNVIRRLYSHKSTLNKNKHQNIYLQRLFNKYGKDNFKFEIIEKCPIENLDEREIYWIAYYGGVNSKLNCNWESGGHKNKTYSKELRNRMSERNKGKSFSPKTQFKKGSIPWNKGKKATTRTIDHQRQSHLGHKVSIETRRKLSIVNKGKRLGKERYNAIGVLKIDIKGNVVAEYDTLTQAGLENGIAYNNIKKRAKHSDRLYDNHYWKLKGESYERDQVSIINKR